MKKAFKPSLKPIIFLALAIGTIIWLVSGQGQKSRPTSETAKVSTDLTGIIWPDDLAAAQNSQLREDLLAKIKGRKVVLVQAGSQTQAISLSSKHASLGTLGNLVEEEIEPNAAFQAILQVLTKDFTLLAIGSQTSKENIDQLSSQLQTNCPDCLLISLSSLSQSRIDSLAENHDRFLLSALANLDGPKANQAETASPAIFYLTTSWAKFNQAAFHLVERNRLEGKSYLTAYFQKKASCDCDQHKATSFIAGGDLMFDRNVNHLYKDQGFAKIFDKLGDRVFWGSDLSLANLEGPISDKEIDDDYQSGSLIFNFPPATTETLKKLHLTALSLGNNHSLNAGEKGIANTRQVLEAAGIVPIGHQIVVNNRSLYRLEADFPLSVIAVNMLEQPDRSILKKMIETEVAAGRRVIMFPHWGAEYQAKHNASQEVLAREWIKAGANLIIGSHPHVVQDFQIIEGVPVVYSLGNLVFDQFFSAETQQGLLVGGLIEKQSLTLSFYPYKTVNVQPILLEGQAKQDSLKQFFDINNESSWQKISDDTIKIPFKISQD